MFKNILKKASKRITIGKLKKFISFNIQNYAKIHKLSCDEIIKNFEDLSKISTQNPIEQLKEKLILINHTREKIVEEANYNPNYTITVDNLREISLKVHEEITEEEVNNLNSEELYSLMASFIERDNTALGNMCMNRFYDLIKEDLKDESYTVDMRVLECHMFSRIIGVIGYSKEPFINTESFGDFELYVDAYVKRHKDHFSYFDKAQVLAIVVDIANPISEHLNFVTKGIISQNSFTPQTFFMSLASLAKVEAIIKTSSLKNFESPIDSELNPLGHLTSKVKFVNSANNEPHEGIFLCEAASYLGILKKGNLELWEYMIRRFNKVGRMISPENLCNFIEGVKRRGLKLPNYHKIIELGNFFVENWEMVDFDSKTQVFALQTLLKKDKEVLIDKDFERRYLREFEMTDFSQIDNLMTLQRALVIAKNHKRVDIYVDQIQELIDNF